jgi:hypothetical protein
MKSQTARSSGGSVDVVNQLTTIRLNSAPQRGLTGKVYRSPPVRGGKTVLLVDDFCTEGNSFEAGSAFINATGAKTICLSWLKTINTQYRALSKPLAKFDPYSPLVLKGPLETKIYSYSGAIASRTAQINLDDIYQRYYEWAWPPGH